MGEDFVAMIGKRLTIRLFEAGGGYRDIVGHIESSTTLRNRSGDLISFNPSQIAAWREIKPLPDLAGRGAPKSMRIRELEDLFSLTWVPDEMEMMGQWCLRASGKITLRANSVLPRGLGPYGEPECEVDEAIKKVIDFYSRRNQEPIFQISLPLHKDLDMELEKRGWVEKLRVHVMVGNILHSEVPLSSSITFEISEKCSDEWLALQDEFAIKKIVERSPALYATLRKEGQVIAVVRSAQQGSWVAITRLFVSPEYRGQDLGRQLMQLLFNEVTSLGINKVALQVNEENLAAHKLYLALGFKIHHDFIFRTLNL